MPTLPPVIFLRNGDIDMKLLRRLFPTLKERHFIVINLFFNEGKTIKEIAMEIGVQNAAIRHNLGYAIAVLRRKFDPRHTACDNALSIFAGNTSR